MRVVDGEIRIKPRREEVEVAKSGAEWHRQYCLQHAENELTEALTVVEIHRMVKELR